MQTAVTLTPAHTYVMNNTVQVDSTGAPLTSPDPTYSAPAYASNNPSVATLQGNRVTPSGVLGTATITATETSSDNTKPTLTGTLVVTVQGPAADSLQINGVTE